MTSEIWTASFDRWFRQAIDQRKFPNVNRAFCERTFPAFKMAFPSVEKGVSLVLKGRGLKNFPVAPRLSHVPPPHFLSADAATAGCQSLIVNRNESREKENGRRKERPLPFLPISYFSLFCLFHSLFLFFYQGSGTQGRVSFTLLSLSCAYLKQLGRKQTNSDQILTHIVPAPCNSCQEHDKGLKLGRAIEFYLLYRLLVFSKP